MLHDTLVRGGTVVFPERGPEDADILIRESLKLVEEAIAK